MSAAGERRAGAGSRRGLARLREFAPFIVLAVALALAAVFTGGPPDEGIPLDPRSPGPLGTKALVDVLGELGLDVEIVEGVPGDDVDTALVLADRFDDAGREELLAWVAGGRQLVVADYASPLTPEVSGPATLGFTTPSIGPGDCPLAPLADLGRVTTPGAQVYEAPEGSVGCYPRNEGFWLVARQEGQGRVVALGGPQTFTNIELGAQRNAVLAATLLAPEGTESVAVLEAPPPGSGDAGLLDLIPPRVRAAFWQLLIAFGVVVLWRARRLGRPVVEPRPVEVPGSELVVARGNLLRTARRPARAAALLRADARRVLAERLGLPVSADAATIADAAAARSGARREDVLAVLGDAPGDGEVDESRLVALAQSVEGVRRATLAAPDTTRSEGEARVH